MDYFISFLEGIITFISPCLLPMIPIYIVYFAGDGQQENKPVKTLVNALGFVLGFTLVFIVLGAFAGSIGGLLVRYQNIVNIIAGSIVILFGLGYMGVFKLRFMQGGSGGRKVKIKGFVSALLFGIVFSISWTPCVGTFLGSALMLASVKGSALQGIVMLLCYSAGLGIPFVASAVLIGKLKTAFEFIKRHYITINRIAGAFLILTGILMATGLLGRFLTALGGS